MGVERRETEKRGEETWKICAMLLSPLNSLLLWVGPELGNRRNFELSDKCEL